MDAPYIFHGHDVSYFSGKVRPAFPQKSLWYREVLPDIREIIRRTGLNYFPVVFTPDGEIWQDTSDILDQLEQRHPEPALYPSSPVQRVVAYLVELYGDEIGLLPAMHYRWSFEESVKKVVVDFSTPTGTPGRGAKFAAKMSGTLPGIGVTEDTIPAIEAHTRALLDALSAHFDEHRFLLGDAMSLADCGLMGPMYGHLFRDAVPERLLYSSAFNVCAWIERMNRPPMDQSGWLAADAIADSLKGVLRVMADGVPFLTATLAEVDRWASENAETGGEPPGVVGFSTAPYRDAEIQIAARPYSVWMAQRATDAYRALPKGDQARVMEVLQGTGWEELLAWAPERRLGKQRYALVWE